VFSGEDGNGAEQDREVERERPVVDVLDIRFHPLDHLFDVPCFTALTPHLGQPDNFAHAVIDQAQ
jgi:hypothetical protein